MKVPCLLTGVLVILSTVECTTLRREKRSVDFITGTCDPSTTQIYTKTIHTTDFTKCPIATLMSRYYEPFLAECEHWMGSRPDHVASSNVYYCLEDPTTGGVRIKATVCCKGTPPPNRCVSCVSTDPEQCDYSAGAVVTCAADETCQTQMSCENNALVATIRKSCVKTCSTTKSCKASTYLEYGQQCVDCCDSAFCNKGGLSLACYHHCQCDDLVLGNYHCDTTGKCVCNAGCTGTKCEHCTATCNPNPCKNKGICTSSGSAVSCCCTPGYGGKYCENKLPSCDRSSCSNHGDCVDDAGKTQCICDPGYFGETCQKISETFNCPQSKNIYFSNPTPLVTSCSSVMSTPLSFTSELSACKYYMRSQYGMTDLFKEGKNGHVAKLTDVGYNFCQVGTCGYAHYQTKTCCPSCLSNPCQNGGYCLQIEQKEDEDDYVCRCKFGFTGKYCEKRVQTCFAFGEPHYLTYDGAFFTYQGACRYILTMHAKSTDGLTPFAVYIKNEYRGTDKTISYPSYVEVDVYGYRVRMGKDNVVLVKGGSEDFQQVSLNAVYSEFSIKTTGRFVRLETSFGLVVQFDGYNMMFVQISDAYKDKLSGLCNNMDGDASNDLRDCTGLIRSDDEVGHTLYGDSCLDPAYTSDPGTCKTKAPDACDTEKYTGNEWCGYITDTNGPFKSCMISDSKYDFIACKYDVCRDQSAKCQALESFVEKCYKSGGAPDSNWRAVTKCEMNCPTNAHYEFSGSACQPTCENPKAHLACAFDDTEVCQCDGDMLLRDGECVPKSKCGCKDSKNIRHEVDEVWGMELGTCLQSKCVECTDADCKLPGKIIEETTPPIDGMYGDWGSWSGCTAGVKVESRERWCDSPSPTCGGMDCNGDSSETRECPTNPPPTTTTTTERPPAPTAPPCAKGFDYAKSCRECDRTRNPNMYIANPCGCETYFQCIPDNFGDYYVKEMPCSYCTCWNQTILTCDHDIKKRNKNHDKCTDTFMQQTVTDNGGTCTVKSDGSSYVRRFRAIPGDKTHYIDTDAGDLKMPCAPGTIFDSRVCGCIHGENNQLPNEFMCLSFNNKDDPYRTSTGVWVSPSSSGLIPGETGIEGYGLRFDGGNLEVPAFNNKEINRMTISLWFKRDRPTYNGMQALVANDDCTNKQLPTIQMLSKSLTSVGGGVQTHSSNILDDLFTGIVDDRKWHHVAMTYDVDTEKAAFYLDGNLKNSKAAIGPISGAHCPLLIGSLYSGNYFHGVMDQICFYDHAFTASQVRSLYRGPAPRV